MGLSRRAGTGTTRITRRIPQSEAIFRRRSTNWQREVFNAGQFACDRALFANFAALHETAHAPGNRETCLYPIGDQPGINLLRLLSGVPLSNVTLPPVSMESTWAGDYADADYESYWREADKRPYLIHWAGVSMHTPRPINDLFYRHLTPDELDEWHAQLQARASAPQGLRPRLRTRQTPGLARVGRLGGRVKAEKSPRDVHPFGQSRGKQKRPPKDESVEKSRRLPGPFAFRCQPTQPPIRVSSSASTWARRTPPWRS